jgi:hypothetical protein
MAAAAAAESQYEICLVFFTFFIVQSDESYHSDTAFAGVLPGHIYLAVVFLLQCTFFLSRT